MSIKAWWELYYFSFKDTNRIIFKNSDTLSIRILLAFASLISAISLLVDPDRFDRPAYALVEKFGSEEVWVCYFLVHFFGVAWRIYERTVSRPKWAIVINCWGFSIWFVSTVSMSITTGIGIQLSLSIAMCSAAAWALYRTGLSKDLVSL